jgi:hypothetical protein
MIVTKIALTVGILALLAPLIAAPFDDEFKPRGLAGMGWFDLTIIGCALVGGLSLVIALLAFIWGL